MSKSNTVGWLMFMEAIVLYIIITYSQYRLGETLENELLRCQLHQRFYIQIFRTNGVSTAFSSSYILALAKNSYKKCVHLMLMKFTKGRLFQLFLKLVIFPIKAANRLNY